MAEAGDKELYFADRYLENHEWAAELEEAARNYMLALSRYAADLDSANILYHCTLTSQSRQVEYLFDLQLQIDEIRQALKDTDPAWNEPGYSNDELLERWSGLVYHDFRIR